MIKIYIKAEDLPHIKPNSMGFVEIELPLTSLPEMYHKSDQFKYFEVEKLWVCEYNGKRTIGNTKKEAKAKHFN